MKKIMWISTGGTIFCTQSEKGLSPVSDKTIMDKMLLISGISSCEVMLNTLMNIDSTDITCKDIRKIGTAVNDAISDCFDGIVITHGTDTMAYTGAVLYHMLENAPVPVIITGSQKPFFTENSDAPQNLRNAFSAACDSRFAGVYILFGNRIMESDKAYKAYTESYDAFISPVSYSAIITRQGFTDLQLPAQNGKYRYNTDFCEDISLIKITPCTKPSEILSAVNNGAKGIVAEAYGMGGIPSRLIDAFSEAAANGVKIMLISQCFYEGVFLDVYNVGIRAAECGFISGGQMTAEAALAQLMFTV